MQAAIIVPCYNEEKRLPKQAFVNFSSTNKNIRFLFVNDGSRDRTSEILKNLSHQGEGFTLLELAQNCGKAEAVRQGMLYALKNFSTPYIGFWDADLAVPLDEIGQFITSFHKHNCHIVMGCRLRRLGAHVKRNPVRHYLGRIFATAASIVLKLPVYDTQCGAKIFRTEIVSPLFERPFISHWIFDVELLARYITRFGLEDAQKNIYEYPIASWEEVGHSSVTFKDFLITPLELWKIKRTYFSK